jgi:hypothetical protein
MKKPRSWSVVFCFISILINKGHYRKFSYCFKNVVKSIPVLISHLDLSVYFRRLDEILV